MTKSGINYVPPSEFMKARRPELFSDTFISEQEYLDRGQFEYHLSCLTQRQEEYQFEHFCRRLAEKELCPNLVPQTGPMGGGDAKVDIETYPVSQKIASRWYEGNPNASSERWGFAISAKEKWQPKINSDVKKIVETNRKYSLVYFITNQPVSSKKRAAKEDELTKKWRIKVKILDKTWIVEKVVQNNRWDIVFSTLEIDRPGMRCKKHHGPYDAERLLELEELDSLIADTDRYNHACYQLIEDSLQTALLARGLNRSREEIDGRFDRAERIARNQDAVRQLFRVLYHRAWTTYWWFDDFQELDRLYTSVEELVISSDSALDLEKLVNLWTSGRTWLLMKKKPIDSGNWGKRTEALKQALMAHAMDSTRRTNSLIAQTQLVLMDLNDSVLNRDRLPKIWKLLTGILKQTDGLLDYHVDTLITIIQELGPAVDECAEYNDLLELAIDIQSRRVGKAQQGQMRLNFGFQKLEKGKPYEAIEQFGKAQFLLADHEHLKEFVRSLLGIAEGYKSVGLLWAARANLIQAFERTTNEYLKDGIIGYAAYPILRRLLWVEMQLGRVPCILGWIMWLGIINQMLDFDEKSRLGLENELNQLDAILGILILKTDFSSWNYLGHVAGLFDRFQLFMSRAAVLFSMGYEDLIRKEFKLPEEEDLDDFFSLWLEQPACKDLPDRAEWFLSKEIKIGTSILGCNVEVRAQNNFTSIVLGETLLAFFESFMASTVSMERVYSSRNSLCIDISESNQAEAISYRVKENEYGEIKITISHSSDTISTIVQNESYQLELNKLLAEFICQLQVRLDDVSLEALFAEEKAQDRAHWAATMPIALSNIMGDTGRYSVEEWTDHSPEERLILKREAPCFPSDNEFKSSNESMDTTLQYDEEKYFSEVFDKSSAKHKDIEITSAINVPLWDQARWGAAGFVFFPGQVPNLVLCFNNIDPAEKIFRGWNHHIKNGNLDELVDVTFVKGINKAHPAHYRIVIGPNLASIHHKGGSNHQLLLVSRIQTMEPSDSTNLDNFLKEYANAKKFYLLPGSMHSSGHILSCPPELIMIKNNLRVVYAWEIGPNDLVSAALLPDDDPIIPVEISNPPCRATLNFLRKICY